MGLETLRRLAEEALPEGSGDWFFCFRYSVCIAASVGVGASVRPRTPLCHPQLCEVGDRALDAGAVGAEAGAAPAFDVAVFRILNTNIQSKQ